MEALFRICDWGLIPLVLDIRLDSHKNSHNNTGVNCETEAVDIHPSLRWSQVCGGWGGSRAKMAAADMCSDVLFLAILFPALNQF